MIELQGLRSLIYRTHDIKADTEWWTKIIGHKPYFEAECYVGFNIDGYEIGLFDGEKVPESGLAYIGVEDAKQSYANLLESGCKPFEEPVDVGEGIIMASAIRDNGQIVGLIQNPHFKAK